jgi:hypothetical protein
VTRTVDEDHVSNFGYFLRFVMRKKRLRAPQVASLLDWKTAYVEKILYGSEPPPAEGEVERLIVALRCDALEADGLRLFALPNGPHVGLRRQADERAAELFEARAALEEKEKEVASLRAQLARRAAGGAAAAKGDDEPTRPIRSDEMDEDRSRAYELWKQLLPSERALVFWLLEQGTIAHLVEVLGRAGWKPQARAQRS